MGELLTLDSGLADGYYTVRIEYAGNGYAVRRSRWAASRGHRAGTLPPLDLDGHARLVEVLRALVADDLLAGVHDVSDGGLAVTLAEMAVRSGVGFRVAGVDGHGELFSEAPSRVVACAAADAAQTVFRRAQASGVPVAFLGGSGGDRLVVEGLVDVTLAHAVDAWRSKLPAALGQPL